MTIWTLPSHVRIVSLATISVASVVAGAVIGVVIGALRTRFHQRRCGAAEGKESVAFGPASKTAWWEVVGEKLTVHSQIMSKSSISSQSRRSLHGAEKERQKLLVRGGALAGRPPLYGRCRFGLQG